MKIVLQKFIAQAGYCSRRQAEEFIKKGRVFINGKIAEPGVRADENDEVKIGGKRLALHKKLIYIKLNKPKGYVCTNRSFRGEKSVFDLVDVKDRLFVVGRLDKDSRGLVLLTNDGDLTQEMTHPRYGYEKRYLAIVERIGAKHECELIARKLKNGVDIGEGDGIAKAKEVEWLGERRGLTSGTRGQTSAVSAVSEKFKITLTEGKKRQIRRMFKALGFQVADLVRVSIGGLELGNLKEGQWKYLGDDEIKKACKVLRAQEGS